MDFKNAELVVNFGHGSGDFREIDLSKRYPDGMPIVDSGVRGFAAALFRGFAAALLRPRTLESFVTAMFWFDAMNENAHGGRRYLALPFIPGARQDRLNDTGDQLFTLKSVAKMINDRKFDEVVVVDPHSEVAPALIERCRVVSAASCLQSYNSGLVAVVAPDGGAEKRAAKVAQKLGVPLVHAWKKRDVATGKLSGFGMEAIGIGSSFGSSGRLLVVDDICDGGGTFLGVAEKIEERGYTADLFVTHGIFSQGTEKLLSKFKHVYTTDSVLGDKPGVEVTSICESLLKGTIQ